MASKAKIRLIPSGVAEVAKSPGVQYLLYHQGAKCASACNSIGHLSHSKVQPKYDWGIKMLDHTAACRVGCANTEAYVDNRIHNTLKKGCGI